MMEGDRGSIPIKNAYLVHHSILVAGPRRIDTLHRRLIQDVACLDGSGSGAQAIT